MDEEPLMVTTEPRSAEFDEQDLAALRDAKRRLENPSLTARISGVIGKPLETGFRMLPARIHNAIGSATQAALLTALDVSLKTMAQGQPRRSQVWLHRAAAIGTGAAGGALGAVALPVELPLSTIIILRSIADVARGEQQDVSTLETKLACLEVFALGGGGTADEVAETGYWMVRSALSHYVADAANQLAGKSLSERGTPAVLRLIAQIASRFGLVVTEEVAATMVPVAGAVSGAAINYLFINHFQDIARGHFVVKRLEHKYGTAAVRRAYEALVV